MARGYWVGRVDVHDTEAYKDYQAEIGAVFARFGARFVVRGGAYEVVSGTTRARNFVVEFPDYETALACWRSQAYQAARAKQKGGTEADIIVTEGYDGPQPGEREPQPATPASE